MYVSDSIFASASFLVSSPPPTTHSLALCLEISSFLLLFVCLSACLGVSNSYFVHFEWTGVDILSSSV